MGILEASIDTVSEASLIEAYKNTFESLVGLKYNTKPIRFQHRVDVFNSFGQIPATVPECWIDRDEGEGVKCILRNWSPVFHSKNLIIRLDPNEHLYMENLYIEDYKMIWIYVGDSLYYSRHLPWDNALKAILRRMEKVNSIDHMYDLLSRYV